MVGLTHENATDRLLVEVEGDTEQAARELEELGGHGVGQALDAGDAVGDRRHVADGLLGDARRPIPEMLPERSGDVFGGDGQVSQWSS